MSDPMELPCDCEPQPYVSYLLTLRPRSFAEAVRDVSKHRGLEPWVFALLREMRELRPSAEIVCMAQVRARRQP